MTRKGCMAALTMLEPLKSRLQRDVVNGCNDTVSEVSVEMQVSVL